MTKTSKRIEKKEIYRMNGRKIGRQKERETDKQKE